MTYIPRLIAKNIQDTLLRGKSVLLLGARQTGKTTLIEHQIKPDISYSFAQASIRQRYEKDPSLLEYELEEKIKSFSKPPVIFIDEVQKIPRIMDVAQIIIDKKAAQFIFTGSSAFKIKNGRDLNLLPGRVVSLIMTPLSMIEMPKLPKLEDLLLYGSLPGIFTESNLQDRDIDLNSYVITYLEEEIRLEALVRNVGSFSRFLEVAAAESGKQMNFTRLSQDVGVSDTTIANYFQILEDCLITSRIDPITQSQTKRRLIKSPKYIFFDLGVRRACAHEGIRLPERFMADLFEQFVGNELTIQSKLFSPNIRIKYWRDSAGPEIDFVLDIENQFIPIEVKFSEKPNMADAKHIHRFMDDYPQTKQGYVVCRTPQKYKISNHVMALPWQEMNQIIHDV